MRPRRGLGLVALGCFGGLALWSGLSVLWAWLPGDATTEASRTLFYAAAFAIVLLAVRTQRDAATMVGLIAAATGLITLYGCVKLAQSAPESYMIYGRVGWPTGYPNTSAALGVLAFWTLVGVGAERTLLWPVRALALGVAVPALGFAVLTQSRGAAVTLILVSPLALALVRERLRLTAFLLVALAGLLPALPALRTAVDDGTAASAGTAASRLLLGGVIVAALWPRVASPTSASRSAPSAGGRSAAVRRSRSRSARCSWPGSRCSRTPRAASATPSTRSRSSMRRAIRAPTCSRSSPTAGTSGRSPPTISRRGPSRATARAASGRRTCARARAARCPRRRTDSCRRSRRRSACPGSCSVSGVGAIGLAGLLRRRRQPSTALAGAAVGTACVLAHAQVDWHWQVPAVALPVVGLVALGAALHPEGAALPRRSVRIGGAVVLALALLWVLPGFASERLKENAINHDDPSAARLAATISPFDPSPLRLAARARAAAARPRGRARRSAPRARGVELVVARRPARRQGQGARRPRLCARAHRRTRA